MIGDEIVYEVVSASAVVVSAECGAVDKVLQVFSNESYLDKPVRLCVLCGAVDKVLQVFSNESYLDKPVRFVRIVRCS